jgi:hypothetical protein
MLHTIGEHLPGLSKNESTFSGNTHMAASTNIVANADSKKTEVNNQLIENLRAELSRVKADLKDELDKVNADAERLRAFNVSHR